MDLNFLTLALAAAIPMLTGFVWYHPKVFGDTWKGLTGLSDEQLKGGNMAVIFGVSYLLSFMLAIAMLSVVIHQMGVFSLMQGLPDGEQRFKDLMAVEDYATRFRTFKHGSLHGAIMGFFVALPILGTNALFERKGWKYIGVNVGYWVLTLTLMGGVICQWGTK